MPIPTEATSTFSRQQLDVEQRDRDVADDHDALAPETRHTGALRLWTARQTG
jgi:hypothetical protein